MDVEPVNLKGLKGPELRRANKLRDLLKDVALNVTDVAEIWLKLDEETRQRFIESSPSQYRYFWERLTLIGEGRLHPSLYSTRGRIVQLFALLPLAEQQKLLTEGVRLVDEDKVVRNLEPLSLTSAQTRQVFRLSGGAVSVRDIPAQKKYLDAKSKKTPKTGSAGESKAKSKTAGQGARPGFWTIRNGRAQLSATLQKKGLSLEDARTLVRDLRRAEKA